MARRDERERDERARRRRRRCLSNESVAKGRAL